MTSILNNDVNIPHDDVDVDTTRTIAKIKAEANLAAGYDVAAVVASAPPPPHKKRKSAEEEESKRIARLESNRKAAQESRRRKKVLVEELQRSVIFFTRANAQLRQKNDGLRTMLLAARSQMVASSDGGRDAGGELEPKSMTTATTAVDSAGDMQESSLPSDSGGGKVKDAKSSPTTTTELTTIPCLADTPLPPEGEVRSAATTAVSQEVPQATNNMMIPQLQLNINSQNALMANWLALAQAQAASSSSISMVPNPILSAFPVFFNPMASMANMPFSEMGKQQQHHQHQHQQVEQLRSRASPPL